MLLGKDIITPEKVLSTILIFSGVYLVSFSGGVKMFDKPAKEPDINGMME
jgi:drug/metabolite transporter (DMT)-like permease